MKYIKCLDLALKKINYMAEFLEGTMLSARLEELVRKADKHVWLIAPYISLHERIRKELARLKEQPSIQLVVIFGKNEANPSITLSPEDLSFLQQLPNIVIGYEKSLHTRCYASEHGTLLTSLNLHQYTQHSSIETGIYLKSQGMLNIVANKLTDSEHTGEIAVTYFQTGVIDTAYRIYEKTPNFESTLLGLSKKYTGSAVKIDKTTEFFSRLAGTAAQEPLQEKPQPQVITPKSIAVSYPRPSDNQPAEPIKGYCIRTGAEIAFNPKMPYTPEAYQSWAIFEDPDYPERFCHLTGKPSGGRTSMRFPILKT